MKAAVAIRTGLSLAEIEQLTRWEFEELQDLLYEADHSKED